MEFGVKQFEYFVYTGIQKITVVAYKQKSAGKAEQKILQPCARFYVQIVCRFVQKQNVGILQQNLCERNTHLPAAGKSFDRLVEIGFFETQARKYLLGPARTEVPLRIGKVFVDLPVTLQKLCLQFFIRNGF